MSVPPLFADRVEVTIARAELEAGAEDLEAALAATDPHERRERVRSATAHFGLSARALDEICDRRQETRAPKAPKKGTRRMKKHDEKPRQRAADEARIEKEAQAASQNAERVVELGTQRTSAGRAE